MKATGIVRRIDDLGRIVIPKELRRNLNIKEGDPLELFTTNDGMVCFKKYMPTTEREWAKARDVIRTMYPRLSFALYNSMGDKMACNGTFSLTNKLDINDKDVDDLSILTTTEDKDTIGYFKIHPKTERELSINEETNLRQIIDVLLTEKE